MNKDAGANDVDRSPGSSVSELARNGANAVAGAATAG